MNGSGSKTPLIAVFVGITVLAVIALVYLIDFDQAQEAKLPSVDVKSQEKEVTVPRTEVTPPEQTSQPKSNN